MNIKPIRTEEDYEAALKRIDTLMDSIPGTLEFDELDVLVTLVESYEEKLHLVAKFLSAKDKVGTIHALAKEFHVNKDEQILAKIETISNEILEEL